MKKHCIFISKQRLTKTAFTLTAAAVAAAARVIVFLLHSQNSCHAGTGNWRVLHPPPEQQKRSEQGPGSVVFSELKTLLWIGTTNHTKKRNFLSFTLLLLVLLCCPLNQTLGKHRQSLEHSSYLHIIQSREPTFKN